MNIKPALDRYPFPVTLLLNDSPLFLLPQSVEQFLHNSKNAVHRYEIFATHLLTNRALSNIIENPIGFIGNLVNSVKRGFQQFASNILTHLRAGLIGWLFGALAGAGLQPPERFDLRGIVSLVMQILGLTYQR